LINNNGSSSNFGVNAVSISWENSQNADVISFKNSTGTIHHSAIVSSYQTDYYGHPYAQTICQHSYGAGTCLDYPLSVMVSDYGSSNVYCAWIAYYYK